MELLKNDLHKLEIIAQEIVNSTNNADINDTLIEETINKSGKLKEILDKVFEPYKENKTIEFINYNDASDLVRRIILKYTEMFEYVIADDIVEIDDIGNIIKEVVIKEDLSDSLNMYLNEIGKIPLLTPDEEIKLFTKYKENNDINAYKKICESNLRLVVSIAKRYIGLGVDFEDLIQEGNIGLMSGIQKFDLNKNCRLSTYATWWIRQSISRYIFNKGRIVRLPVHLMESINKLKQVRKEFINSNDGKNPTIDELSNITGFSIALVERCLKNEREAISLDSPVGSVDDNRQQTLKDIIPDSKESVEEASDKLILKDIVSDLLLELDNLREREIIILRFGLCGKNPTSIDSLAKKYNVTPDRIRKIEANALRKLRNPNKSYKLKDFRI